MLQSDPTSTTATVVVITTQEEPRYANLLHSVQCMAIRYTRRKGVQLQQQHHHHLVLGLVAIGDRAAALRWRRRRTRLLPLHKLQRLGDDPLTCIAMTSDANPIQSLWDTHTLTHMLHVPTPKYPCTAACQPGCCTRARAIWLRLSLQRVG